MARFSAANAMAGAARLALLTLTALTGTATAQQPYEFVVDGEREEVHFLPVEWAEGRPGPGDIVWVAGFEFVLDAPGTVHLERGDEGRLWRVDGDERVLVGLDVRKPEHVAGLTDAQLRAVRSVEFGHWIPEYEDVLARIDPTRCFVRFTVFTHLEELPTLPTKLRYLDLVYSDLKSLDGLDRLTELRLLRVPAEDELTDLTPIARLVELRHLQLDESGAHDLTALGGHPTLRTVRAAHVALTRLPAQAMPALTDLIAHDSGCPADEVARFCALQPRTRVVTTRRELLRAAVADATRLRIRTGSTCHPAPSDREVFASRDRDEIEALVAQLRTRERFARDTAETRCEQHTLEFYDRQGRMLAEVGLFDDSRVRSYRLWGLTPAGLEAAARPQLRAWLEARGVELRR